MSGLLTDAINVFFKLLYILIIVRVFMSWIPNSRYSAVRQYYIQPYGTYFGSRKKNDGQVSSRRRNDAGLFPGNRSVYTRHHSDYSALYSQNVLRGHSEVLLCP